MQTVSEQIGYSACVSHVILNILQTRMKRRFTQLTLQAVFLTSGATKFVDNKNS